MVIVWVSIFQALKAQVVWWLGCSKPKPKANTSTFHLSITQFDSGFEGRHSLGFKG